MKANKTQVAGTHYASAFQHWDFVAAALGGNYMEGQITKYVCRWKKKNGVQDLEKALHFTNKLIELRQESDLTSMHEVHDVLDDWSVLAEDVREFCKANELGNEESYIMLLCATWETSEHLYMIKSRIEALVAAARQ